MLTLFKKVCRTYFYIYPEIVSFYIMDYHFLDAIIAVGYRVSSLKATRFRQWATKILNEYIKKGFVMDDERYIIPMLHNAMLLHT